MIRVPSWKGIVQQPDAAPGFVRSVAERDVEQVDIPRQLDLARDVGLDDLAGDGQRGVLGVVSTSRPGAPSFAHFPAEVQEEIRRQRIASLDADLVVCNAAPRQPLLQDAEPISP